MQPRPNLGITLAVMDRCGPGLHSSSPAHVCFTLILGCAPQLVTKAQGGRPYCLMPLSPLILNITEALADLSIIGSLITRAANDPSVFTKTDKAFSWLKSAY